MHHEAPIFAIYKLFFFATNNLYTYGFDFADTKTIFIHTLLQDVVLF